MNAPDHLHFSESHEWVDATTPDAAAVGISDHDIYSPVSGEIVEVNSDLAESPEAINEDPYGAGWMVKIKLSDPAELDALMTGNSYREHLS